MNTIRLLLTSLILISSIVSADQPVVSLWQSHDPVLQTRLEGVIRDQGLWQQVKNKRLAITLVDITNIESPEVASVNGNKMYYAASLPKIAILLGAFVEIEAGKLQPDDKLWLDMTRMIRHSDNVAATQVLKRVGEKRLLEILQEPRFALYDSRACA